MAGFWLIQAITGILIVFHWEIGDATIEGAHRPTDLAAIERRIEALAPEGSGTTIGSLWTTAGAPDRYTLFLEHPDGSGRQVRIAGDGTELRSSPAGESTLMGLLVTIHHDLWGGTFGSWVVTISGLLLVTNLALAAVIAWPRGGRWAAALSPARKGPAAARLYSWHRALGLWVVAPALLLVGAGTAMKFESGLSGLLGAEPVSMPANPPSGPSVRFAAAVGAGLAAIPGSSLTAVSFPTAEDATYQVRVREPGEIRRAYGGSFVFVDANNGAVRGTFPISRAEPARAFMSALFPIHTGEAGGLVGRLLVFAFGVWLATMIVLGVLLWARRRSQRLTKGGAR